MLGKNTQNMYFDVFFPAEQDAAVKKIAKRHRNLQNDKKWQKTVKNR